MFETTDQMYGFKNVEKVFIGIPKCALYSFIQQDKWGPKCHERKEQS